MTVGIRVDASTDMGSGHLMRCLGLAEALRSRGQDVLFISQGLPGAQLDRVARRGFTLAEIPPCDVSTDARICVDLARSEGMAAMVVDHYGLDARWETVVRQAGLRLLVVDDLADRVHDCDLLLDSTYPGEAERYAGLAEDSLLLLGPAFALMSPSFAEVRTSGVDPDLVHPRLLCFFGGSDLPNLSGIVLEAMTDAALVDVHVDLVIGSTNPHAEQLRAVAARRGRVSVHEALPSLAPLMSACAWAVGAGGVTTYERLCLGLPSVVVSIAQNQVRSCMALAAAGLIDYADHFAAGERPAGEIEAVLVDRLRTMRDTLASARQSARRGMGLVDGLGTLRACEALIPSNADALSLRPAVHADMALYHRWANDPAVREQAWQSDAIAWSEHEAWFTRRIDDPDTRMLVLMAGDLPVGQVRFERQSQTPVQAGRTSGVDPSRTDPRRTDPRHDVWIVDYSLDAFVRGRGWSTWLLTSSLSCLPAHALAHAQVRPGNASSIGALTAAAWQRIDSGSPDVVVFQSQASS